MSAPVSPRRFSNSSRSNGFAAATTSAPFRFSSGSTPCLRANGRDSVRVMSCASSLSGSILRYGIPTTCATTCVATSSSTTSLSRRASGNLNEASTSTGDSSARRSARPPLREV